MDKSLTVGDPLPLWPDGAPKTLADGPADRPTITPFIPAGPKPTAAMIVCPGGGYHALAAHEAEPVAEWIASLGIAAFLLKYRIRPYLYDVSLLDAQRAIRMVRSRAEQWNIDTGRVGILGFSAGGHLACMAATMFEHPDIDPADPADPADPIDGHSSRPDALVACYAATCFTQEGPGHGMVCHIGDKLGGWADTPGLAAGVSAKTPQAFIWQTSDDQTVPVENSLVFAEALHRAGVPYALHVLPHGRHGLGLAGDIPEVGVWTKLCENWLGQIGFAGPPQAG